MNRYLKSEITGEVKSWKKWKDNLLGCEWMEYCNSLKLVFYSGAVYKNKEEQFCMENDFTTI